MDLLHLRIQCPHWTFVLYMATAWDTAKDNPDVIDAEIKHALLLIKE